MPPLLLLPLLHVMASLGFVVARSRVLDAQMQEDEAEAAGRPAAPAAGLLRRTLSTRRQLRARRASSRLEAFLQIALGFMVAVTQMMDLAVKTQLSPWGAPAEALRTAGSIAVFLACLVVAPLALPAAFRCHRPTFLSAARLAFFALPNIRSERSTAWLLEVCAGCSNLGRRCNGTCRVGTRCPVQVEAAACVGLCWIVST